MAHSTIRCLASFVFLFFLQFSLAPLTHSQVHMLKAGKGKKVSLRYVPDKGFKGTLKLDLNMGAEATMNGSSVQQGSLPTLRFMIRVKVVETKTKGEFSIRVSVKSARILRLGKARSLPKQGIDHLRKELPKLKGFALRTRFSNKGVLLGSKAEGKQVKSPLRFQLIQFLAQALQQVVIPLPDKPMGIGGKWYIIQAGKNMSVKLDSRTEYTLSAISMGRYKINIRLKQNAKPQTLTLGGHKLKLGSFKGNGRGVYHTGPKVVTPRASYSVETTYVLSRNAKGKKEKVAFRIAYAFEMRP